MDVPISHRSHTEMQALLNRIMDEKTHARQDGEEMSAIRGTQTLILGHIFRAVKE